MRSGEVLERLEPSWLRGPADSLLFQDGVFRRRLVVNFVPNLVSPLQRMLRSREDVFPDCTVDAFDTAFARELEVRRRADAAGSERSLCLHSRQSAA